MKPCDHLFPSLVPIIGKHGIVVNIKYVVLAEIYMIILRVF